jgi:glycosyltransferase involved in cell wall biosynthesis
MSRIVVTVATYNRHAGLAALLASLAEVTIPEGTDVRYVVVDNSPDSNARQVVDLHPLEALYVLEPAPGIVAARNRAIEVALALDATFVAFIDDDEIARCEWLVEMLKTMERTGAGVVTGPVRYELPPLASLDCDRARVFSTRRHLEGERIRDVATNNTLVQAKWFLPPHSFRFDPNYSSTGGSDKHLFLRLQRAGARCAWCSKQLVTELVPESRVSSNWLLSRARRNAQLDARLEIELDGRSRLGIAASGFMRLLKAAAILLLRVGGPSSEAYFGARHTLQRGIGQLQAVAGRYFHEYARDK